MTLVYCIVLSVFTRAEQSTRPPLLDPTHIILISIISKSEKRALWNLLVQIRYKRYLQPKTSIHFPLLIVLDEPAPVHQLSIADRNRALTKVHILNCYRCKITIRKSILRSVKTKQISYLECSKFIAFPIEAGITTPTALDWRKPFLEG